MKTELFLLLTIFCMHTAFSETGYVCELDLNCDGVTDRIASGPGGLFGNAGGVFSVTIAATNNTEAKIYIIEGNPKNFVFEKTSGNTGRLWTYWRLGSGEGLIYLRTFRGNEMVESKVKVDVEMRKALLEKVYTDGNILKMTRVENYTPQPGLPWGG